MMPAPTYLPLGVNTRLCSENEWFATKVENYVVLFSIARKILSSVINDVICADGADHFHIPRTANAGNLSAKRFGDLYRVCLRPASRALAMKPHNVSFEQAASSPVADFRLAGSSCKGQIQRALIKAEAWVRSLYRSPNRLALRLPAFAVRGIWKWSAPSAQITSLITLERILRAMENSTT